LFSPVLAYEVPEQSYQKLKKGEKNEQFEFDSYRREPEKSRVPMALLTYHCLLSTRML
jgi:hypothetical protein